MVAERVWTATHAVATPAAPVTAATALATYPAAVQLFKAAVALSAVGRGKTASTRARVVVVYGLGIIELEIAAWLLGATGVDGRCWAEDVVNNHVNFPHAGRHVVMMQVVILAHSFLVD